MNGQVPKRSMVDKKIIYYLKLIFIFSTAVYRIILQEALWDTKGEIIPVESSHASGLMSE
jgi:hypothetical protein